MNPLHQTALLAKRDFLQRARSRAFLVTMLVTVGLVFAVGPLIALASSDPDPSRIGLVGAFPDDLPVVLEVAADSLDIEVVTVPVASVRDGETALESESIDVLVADGSELVWREDPGTRLRAAIVAAFSEIERREAARALGLTDDQLGSLVAPASFVDRSLEEEDPEEEPRRVAAFAGLMVLYISILMFGQFVLMGVMEEKQNRVVEVVLSRVQPWQVLTGKVVGVGVLGLIQIVALAGAGLVALSLVDITDVDLAGIGVRTAGWILLWYLLGYAFYSMLYGALGATVSRQEDMQGAVLIPVILIVPGFFFGQIAAQSPDDLIPRVASLIPLWSPMVMPVRAAVGAASTLEVAVAIVGVVAGIVGLTRLGGRVYRGAILKVGTKVKLREAWRSSRR